MFRISDSDSLMSQTRDLRALSTLSHPVKFISLVSTAMTAIPSILLQRRRSGNVHRMAQVTMPMQVAAAYNEKREGN